MRLLTIMVTTWLLPLTAVLACGVASDCRIGDRAYRIHLPAGGPDGPALGAILFAHGYRGTAAGTMENTGLRALADELGVALIAVGSRGPDWNIPGVPSHSRFAGADELAYIGEVLDDAGRRFHLDPRRVLATGFSAGGMLVWNLACRLGERFAAFAPYSGTFWRGPPAHCKPPVRSLMHIHGTADEIVPMRGRPIADTRQGDVGEAIAMYQRHGGFVPAGEIRAGELRCEVARNPEGSELDLCLFDGGHSFRTEFLRFAWSRLMPSG